MIIANSVGPGTYDFTWDGGNAVFIVSAAAWNGDQVFINFVDELGQSVIVMGNTGDTTYIGLGGQNTMPIPPGTYNLVVNSATGLNATIHRIPG